MKNRILLILFLILVSFSFVYPKKMVLTLACLPPEGNMDEKAKLSYVTAVETAFTDAGHLVADRQRLDQLMKEVLLQQSSGMVDETTAAAEAGKVMKVEYLVAVIVDKWDEEQVNSAASARAAANMIGSFLGNSQTTVSSGKSDLITVEKVRISVKVIDVETSFVLASGVGQGKLKDDPSKITKKIVKDLEKQLKKRL